MELKDVISSLRLANKLSQQEFADKIGVSLRTIGNWENGTTTPHMGQLRRMAEAFGFSTWEEVLAKHAKAKPFSQQIDPSEGIPVFEKVPAGEGDFDPTHMGEDNGYAINMFPAIAIPPAARKFKKLYAVIVSGDSMQPDYNDGDTVFCAEDAPHEQGMAAVYRLTDGDCGLKCFEAHGEEVMLIPRNPKHRMRRVMQTELVRVAKVVAHLKATI